MQSGNDSIITLGKINGVFGVKGWVKIYSYTAQQDDILSYKDWYLHQGGEWRKVKLLSGQRQGKGIIANINGVDDRDQALALQGVLIGTTRDSLPELPADQFYWSDLMGMNVVTVGLQQLGEISHLFETGANDVMVVKGDRERWIPWVMNDVIKQVDLDEGVVRVDWDPEF